MFVAGLSTAGGCAVQSSVELIQLVEKPNLSLWRRECLGGAELGVKTSESWDPEEVLGVRLLVGNCLEGMLGFSMKANHAYDSKG